MKLKQLQIIIAILFLSVAVSSAATFKTGKFIGGKDTTMPSWFLNSFLDLSEDVEEQAKLGKRVMVFIHQPNCPYCHRFVTKNLEEPEVKAKLQEDFAVVEINMFGDREVTDIDGNVYTEKGFAIRRQVQFTPTLIFFDEKGKQVLRLNGYMPVDKFSIALDYVKGKYEDKLTYKEYVQKVQQASSVAANTNSVKATTEVLKRDASSNALAVFFEPQNCKDCTRLNTIFTTDKVISKLLRNIDIAKVNIDSNRDIVTPNNKKQTTKQWIKELDITFTPTIIFFDQNGAEIIRIESSLKRFHLQTVVDYVSSRAYKTEAEFQRYLTQRANAIRAKGIDVDIWKD